MVNPLATKAAIQREALYQPFLPLTVLFKQQFGRKGATFMLACDRAVSANAGISMLDGISEGTIGVIASFSGREATSGPQCAVGRGYVVIEQGAS